MFTRPIPIHLESVQVVFRQWLCKVSRVSERRPVEFYLATDKLQNGQSDKYLKFLLISEMLIMGGT